MNAFVLVSPARRRPGPPASALACAALPLGLYSCGWGEWEGVCVRRCRLQWGCAAAGRVATTPGGLTRSSPSLARSLSPERERTRGDRMITSEPYTRARTAEPEQSAAEHKPS
jgi:hypothetical protein